MIHTWVICCEKLNRDLAESTTYGGFKKGLVLGQQDLEISFIFYASPRQFYAPDNYTNRLDCLVQIKAVLKIGVEPS